MRWPFLTPVALACRSSSSFVSFEMGAEICVARAIFFFPFKEKSNARLRTGQAGLGQAFDSVARAKPRYGRLARPRIGGPRPGGGISWLRLLQVRVGDSV